jgi:site-specific DNA-methyltransferase (adenine-specific)
MIEDGRYRLYQGDCLEIMKNITDKSIDMILCDLPYQVTQNKWDTIIPMNDFININNKNIEKNEFYLQQFMKGLTKNEINKIWKKNKQEGLWTYYNRIIKDNGAIVLFAQDIFSAQLINSNPKMYKYKFFWKKDRPSGFLNAKKMPLKNIEEILIFYKKCPTYNPQFWEGIPLHGMGTKYKEGNLGNNNYGKFASHTNPSANREGDTKKYPRQLLEFKRPHPPIFPTQKPVDLCEYLIKTYTNESEVILDNCMGSGSTGVACLNTNRRFVGIELDEKYFNIAKNRIENIS